MIGFVHHTTEVVQSIVIRLPVSSLPSLPTEWHVRGELANEVVVFEEYVALTSYQSCHSTVS